MRIICNGQSLDVAEGCTLLQCLENQGLAVDKVVVERNTHIVPASDFATTILEADDILEILHFVGGG